MEINWNTEPANLWNLTTGQFFVPPTDTQMMSWPPDGMRLMDDDGHFQETLRIKKLTFGIVINVIKNEWTSYSIKYRRIEAIVLAHDALWWISQIQSGSLAT